MSVSSQDMSDKLRELTLAAWCLGYREITDVSLLYRLTGNWRRSTPPSENGQLTALPGTGELLCPFIEQDRTLVMHYHSGLFTCNEKCRECEKLVLP